MRDLLVSMRAIDVAWNERRWDDYGDLLSDELVAYSSGETRPHGKPHHIAKAKTFCATFPDAKVRTDPYRELLASGEKTCSVARITGTAPPDLVLPNGEILASPGRAFDLTFAAICTWRAGRIIDQHEYIDTALMLRQLRGAPQ
jgi:ketosteroid isomerase-like protein